MLANKLAISSPSLGRHVSHGLEEKIILASKHGFAGIEIVYNELLEHSKTHDLQLLEAAQAIKSRCDEVSLEILSLAPFENFEGSAAPLSDRLGLAQKWIDVARALGATYLQVPAQYDRTSTGIQQVIVSELQELADLASAATPIVNIAYEPMSWSVHISTWEAAWNVIENVNRPNFGLCLDSFHIVTKLWGNALDASGKYPDADEALRNSLTLFKTKFPLEKLFFVQLSDGERFNSPFSARHPWYTPGEAAEFTWSKFARPFPLEADLGGYMPVAEFLKSCVVDTGFKGWVSLEIFDRRMNEEGFRLEEAAVRAQSSWKKLLRKVGGTKI